MYMIDITTYTGSLYLALEIAPFANVGLCVFVSIAFILVNGFLHNECLFCLAWSITFSLDSNIYTPFSVTLKAHTQTFDFFLANAENYFEDKENKKICI